MLVNLGTNHRWNRSVFHSMIKKKNDINFLFLFIKKKKKKRREATRTSARTDQTRCQVATCARKQLFLKKIFLLSETLFLHRLFINRRMIDDRNSLFFATSNDTTTTTTTNLNWEMANVTWCQMKNVCSINVKKKKKECRWRDSLRFSFLFPQFPFE